MAETKKGRPAKPKEVQADPAIEVGEQIVKTKQSRNRPDLAKFGEENTKPGDNSRFLRLAMVSLSLPPIDISDPKQVEQRITDYFQFCLDNDRKPNMKGIGNWLGISRETVNNWKRGDYRGDTHCDLIKKAVDILEELWVDYMLNGKVNPASGIFLGKNMFDYKDEQTYNLVPTSPLGEDGNPTTIAGKYKTALPGATIEGEIEKK
jgi:hypothetical protein